MKIITVKGVWNIFDGEREITVTDGSVAFGYAMTMAQIRPIPCTTPTIHPVRSLVPHPKKRRLTKKYRELIKKIKAEMPSLTL